MEKEAKQPFVKFVVGGRYFEASRSLIDQQPGSMLSRMISDTWHEDPGRCTSIDRDGDTFAQVLNYLRYGTITLPAIIPKDMFIRDLDYYGLCHDEASIKDGDERVAELEAKANDSETEKKRLAKELAAIKEGVGRFFQFKEEGDSIRADLDRAFLDPANLLTLPEEWRS